MKSVATTFPAYNTHFNKTHDDIQQLHEAENPGLCHAEEPKTKYFYFLYFPVTPVSTKPCHTLSHTVLSRQQLLRIGVREKHHILCDRVRNKHEIAE